jgi:hypothetical protein
VGRGALTIDSSIWVATITDLARSGQGDRPGLNRGHLLERKLHAQVAARHHDPVECVHDLRQDADRFWLLDLGDQRDPGAAGLVHDLAGRGRVVRTADEGHRDYVHARRERPAQVGFVLAGQRGGADCDARQVDALAVGDLPADQDCGADPGAGLAGHL